MRVDVVRVVVMTLLMLVAAAGAACSSTGSVAGPVSTGRPDAGTVPVFGSLGSAVPGSTLVPRDAVTSTTGAPITVPVDADAAAIVAASQDAIPLSGPEQACLTARLTANATLRQRLAGGIVPGTSAYNDLVATAIDCQRATTFAVEFADQMRQAHPDLSADQLHCLQAAFAALTSQDVDKIVAATGTQDPTGGEGAALMNQLLAGCHVATTP